MNLSLEKKKKKELMDIISNLANERNVYVHKLNRLYVNINTIDDWHHAKYLFNQNNFDSYKKSLVIVRTGLRMISLILKKRISN